MTRLSDQQWSDLLERFHQSDLTQKQFAQEHSLNVHTFRGRLYRSQNSFRPNSPSPFVQVQLSEHSAPTDHALDLRFGALQLRFSDLPDPRWVASLVDLLHGSR